MLTDSNRFPTDVQTDGNGSPAAAAVCGTLRVDPHRPPADWLRPLSCKLGLHFPAVFKPQFRVPAHRMRSFISQKNKQFITDKFSEKFEMQWLQGDD